MLDLVSLGKKNSKVIIPGTEKGYIPLLGNRIQDRRVLAGICSTAVPYLQTIGNNTGSANLEE
jgi:hypothetical protein